MLNNNNCSEIVNSILTQKYKEIVINDNDVSDYDVVMQKIEDAFNTILPNKSNFEI